MSDDVPDDLVKVSVLAKLSGVPAATIKHYVREGLLPEPVRTSRNMAYYDASLVDRIKRIKELQRTRFLPLKVIKQVLDESELGNQDDTVAATIARVIDQTAPHDERTKAQLFASGLLPEQLELLKSLGIVRPLPDRDEETYSGDDLEVLRVLGASRKAGLRENMLPVDILGQYAQALYGLVELELRLFREGVVPNTNPEELPSLTEAAFTLSERLVMLMRRKMLVPTMRSLAERSRQKAHPAEEPEAPAPKKRARRAPAKRKRAH